MKRNKLKVLSSLAILGIAGLGLASCNNVLETPGVSQTTPAGSSQGGSVTPTPTPTPTPIPTPTPTPKPTTPVEKTLKSISVSLAKTTYKTGEQFSFEGATVTKTYSDDSQEEAAASEITYKIYSDADCTQEVTSIANAGTYYVLVIVGNKDKAVEITVKEPQYTLRQMFDPATLDVGDITENKEIYNKDGNTISVLVDSSKKFSVDSNNYSKIEGYNFTKRLKLNNSALGSNETGLNVDAEGNVTNKQVVVLKIDKASKVNIFARSGSSSAIRNLAITNNGTYSKELECADAMAKQSVELEAGTYYIYSKSGGINIYGIEFETEVPASSVTYSQIELDTSNALTDFNKGTEFKTTGLVVKGLNNYGVWDILDSADYTVTNEDGTAVDTTTVGKKTLKVTAKGQTATYDIQVINPNATVESIAVKDAASKLVYKKGEELSLSGLTITATDSDSLTTNIAYDAEKITYKVLNGEADVTESFTTLTKGAYKVELTYASKTTTYDITVLEAREEGKFVIDNEIAVGTTSYSSKLVIGYTDGTDADWSKYDEIVLSTAEGYSTKFYSDEACTQEIESATKAFEKAGTVYLKLAYNEYSKNFTVTVKDMSSEKYTTEEYNKVTAGNLIFEGKYMKLTAGTDIGKGTDSNIVPNVNSIKLNSNNIILIEAKEKITLTLTVSSNGDNKKYEIKNGDTIVKADGIKKANGKYTIEVELEAGTYSFKSNDGGTFIYAFEATKAE